MDDGQLAFWRVITRTWDDPEFKSRLIDRPRETLAESGIELPDGVEITVGEGDGGWHLTLPPRPEFAFPDPDGDPRAYCSCCCTCFRPAEPDASPRD